MRDQMLNRRSASSRGAEPPRPASGTQEWAVANVNIQTGCDRDCSYCYAKGMAVRFRRATPQAWVVPVVDPKRVNRRFRRFSGRVMFPTTHDISPKNLDECVTVLRHVLEAGNDVLVVSKPQLDCVMRLCAEFEGRKGQILFRFTIGSADDLTLKLWEPGASSFKERLDCLRHAHGLGFATSVSCEPMLDARIDLVVEAVMPFITDAIWLGRANNLRQIISLNSPGDAVIRAAADRLLADQTDEWLRELHTRHCGNPQIRFKDSIKKVCGMARPTEKGLDI